MNKRFQVVDYHQGASPSPCYETREEAVKSARNLNLRTSHPTAVLDMNEAPERREVDVFRASYGQELFQSHRSEIEIIGEFTDSKLKGREILGFNISKGWVHVSYVADLHDYLADRHYTTPGYRRRE